MKRHRYMKVCYCILAFCGLVFSRTLLATPDQYHQNLERPTIGVVLAGGGAKGAAHIGVLKALEELNIPVDYIAGTSMGAYVGGLYATGMSADEIESFIHSVDWNSGYRDKVNRSQRRVRDKEYEDRYQLNVDLGIGLDGFKASKGVVQGQNMLRILRETTGNLPAFNSFDDLAIPYRSVATDIVHLEQVVIDQGFLVDAMMSSMSVPGALPPYELNGHLLVDGGVTNNMPVDVAKAMGADIVIAVDISTDYKSKEDFNNFLAVADQLSNYLVRRSTKEQSKNLINQDVYLKPNVGSMETTEFAKMPEAYLAGYQVAYEHIKKLQDLSVNSAQYQAYIDHKQSVKKHLHYGDKNVVDRIFVENNTHYSDELITNRLNIEPGKRLSTKELEESIQALYVLDRFELITYRYDQSDGNTDLYINVKEKSWGPNYADFRFFLEDDFNTTSQYSFGVSTNFTNLNDRGAELRANLDIGTDKHLELELYSPSLFNQKLFTLASVEYNSERHNAIIRDDNSTDLSSEYLSFNYKDFMLEVAGGYQPTLWQEFKIGGRYTDGSVSSGGYTDAKFKRKGVFANYRLDTLDSFSLPTSGLYFDIDYLLSNDKAQDGTNYKTTDTVSEISMTFTAAHTYQRHTLVANMDYGVVMNESTDLLINPRSLGGFLKLSGVPHDSLIGSNSAFSSLVYRYRLAENDFGLFVSPIYLGGSIEYGGVWTGSDVKFKDAPMYAAGSVFVGIDSLIGPMIFSYGQTENNFSSFYLIIGTTFN
ncbi:serine protease [Vibrio sp. 10N.286.49.B3]|uniref:patatin-like phospholipase family protein n=1 Tax=Vibrio sp. 10N.286.49.B3 TaxID=1880855 RepID=UPI000C8324E0|nr:patatin-like phospholipase family protein [Vibrio sp. 10N.286.49.B3]PMH41231.1 serine protease [Vibrio sp. 10N.286.49.B3]